MNRLISLVLFVFTFGAAFAQNHDYLWILGKRLQLDFNYEPPKILQEDVGLEFYSCSTAFSDSSGKKLLFYTNGAKIFSGIDRKAMEGGDSVNFNWGGPRAWYEDGYIGFQPVILPLPNSNKYYVFHHVTAAHPVLPTVYLPFIIYHIIDMDANNGKGKVIEKNKIVMTGDIHSELSYITCAKHANGRDWWIAFTKSYDANLYTFLLDPEGLKGPFTQKISPPEQRASCLFFSSTGKFLVKSDLNVLRVYSFDRCSGKAFPLKNWNWDGTNRTIPYRGVFSHDDRFLYFQRTFWVLQVDMEAFLSADVINYNDKQFWELNYYPTYPCDTRNWLGQLAPNKKIYFPLYGPCGKCLNAINRPDLPGDAADIEEEAIYFLGSESYYISSISINSTPNYRLPKWEGSPCDTLGIRQTQEASRQTDHLDFDLTHKDSKYSHKNEVAPKEIVSDEPVDIYEHYYQLMIRAESISNKNKCDSKYGSNNRIPVFDRKPRE